MSKVKSSEIPQYELLYLISNKYSEEELEPIVKKINDLIKENGAKITHVEEWGKKRLAYPVNHFHYGYYYLVEFEAESETINKIDRAFRLMGELLRHQIIKKIKIKEVKRRLSTKTLIKKTEEKKEKDKQSVKKTNMKDLDEKLDKILDTGDLI